MCVQDEVLTKNRKEVDPAVICEQKIPWVKSSEGLEPYVCLCCKRDAIVRQEMCPSYPLIFVSCYIMGWYLILCLWMR